MKNSVSLIGRLVFEIELRKTNSGKSVTNFVIACNRGGSETEPDFIDCTAWERTAEILSIYGKKGQLIGVDGYLVNDRYNDKDGKERKTQKVIATRIMLLGKNPASEKPDNSAQENTAGNWYPQSPDYREDIDTTTIGDRRDAIGDYPGNNPEEDGPILDITADDLPF